MTTHISQEQLSAWLDRQLEDDAARRIEQHLECCPSCRAAQEEMSALNRLFREMRVLEPPSYLWSKISAGLDEAEPVPKRWFSKLGFPIGRPGWLRAEVWALAATLVVGGSLAVLHWSAARTERLQLAAIDRAYHALLPQNAESYNPFATSPWNDTETNPFTIKGLNTSSSTSQKSLVKR
jgi:anti-sigma factor RsiW